MLMNIQSDIRWKWYYTYNIDKPQYMSKHSNTVSEATTQNHIAEADKLLD